MNNKKYTFPDTIKENNGVMMVTIPSKIVHLLKLKKGDSIELQIEKPVFEELNNEE